VAIFERLADLINGMVLLAQMDDQVASRPTSWVGSGAMSRGEEKGGLGFSAKMMTEDVEGIEGIAKSARHLLGGTALDQVSAQGLVLAMLGQARFEEKSGEVDLSL